MYRKLTKSPAQHVEWVGCEAAQHGELPEVVGPLYEQGDGDAKDDHDDEGDQLPVLLEVERGELAGDLLRQLLLQGLGLGRLCRDEPFPDAQAEVLKEAIVLGHLRLELIDSDAIRIPRTYRIPVEGVDHVSDGLVVKLHAVLLHAGRDHLPQLGLLGCNSKDI